MANPHSLEGAQGSRRIRVLSDDWFDRDLLFGSLHMLKPSC